ncbi:substrate-binding periplasmic protein [Undibacterium sp. Ren11W]|uniref:substrate-binding periplasmic protein n=1 Tax=Undibacterium sp. Ren11W TaxID=3413045 RepID=UPI003BF1EF16
MRVAFQAFVVIACWMWGVQPSLAADILVVGAEFAQIYERNETGEFTGLGVEILRSMARQNGDTLSFQILPWARAQKMVETNQAQILVGPYKTADRETRFVFAEKAFYRDDMVFYALKLAKFQWDGSYSALQDKRIGVINGWAYGAQFEEQRKTMKIESANSLRNALLMLKAKHIDVLASNVRNTEALLNSLDLAKDISAVANVIDNQDGYFAYCKHVSCDQLRVRFDSLFARLKESGELAKMAQTFKLRLP